MTPIVHGVNSNNTKLIKTFCSTVVEHCQEADLYEQIHQLNAQSLFTPENHAKLKAINVELTKILVDADQGCVKKGIHPWSPSLH